MNLIYENDSLLDEFSVQTLKDRYLVGDEKSPQEAYARAAKAFATDDAHAQRIYEYASKRWFMFSTPILTNGGTSRGMPISCFLNYVPDSRKGLSDHYDENIFLSSNGGGIGGFWGDVRSDGTSTSSGSRSSGSIPFMKVVDAQMLAFSQGGTRRGSYAAYIDDCHPEVKEFISIRKPTGGDANRKCLNLHHGVNISDKLMNIISKCMKDPKADDSWELIDPHTKEVREVVSARELWQSLLETRLLTGEPYLHFVDRSNEFLPQTQKDLGLKVRQSNLCSEITLPTNEDRTAVCCLSSVNLELFDEWKDDPLFIRDLVEFLDNVLSFFVSQNADVSDTGNQIRPKSGRESMFKAAYSAYRERSIGLGAMGFHYYLQRNNIPFEGPIAYGANLRMFTHIKEKAEKASRELAEIHGEAPDMIGTGLRNANLLAVAPNASSSIICNTSPSIEPVRANAYTQKTLTGSFLVKNKYIEKLLDELGQNNSSVWDSIIENDGSVQHLEFLTEWQKNTFKTALELDQSWIVEHASVRQKFICQAQSVNLFFRPDDDISYIHTVHFNAWNKGMKSLYYLRSEASSRAEKISTKVERLKIPVSTEPDCLACEG